MNAPVAVILAAGKSTRMKSDRPKVIHELFGRPMIDYVLDSVRAAGVKKTVVVVGHQAETVKSTLAHHQDVVFALQSEQHGTGHAVMVCREHLQDHHGAVLVLAGDTPLLRPESLKGLLAAQAEFSAGCVIGTADTEDNEGLGRIVRSDEGEFECIVEQKDATEDQHKITEINTGCYAFDCQKLLNALDRITTDNQQAEYYLTDCPAIMKSDGTPVVASCEFTIEEAIGVNTRVQLATVRNVIHRRGLTQLMIDGVTIVDPSLVSIDPRARIGRESVVQPFVTINGIANVGERCEIGAHALIESSANVADGTIVDPYSRVS